MAEKSNKTPAPVEASGYTAKETKTTPKPETKKSMKAPEGFELQNWPGGGRIVTQSFGVIDLATLTPARAGQLVARGFKFLKKK
jgi:hypothetical protein